MMAELKDPEYWKGKCPRILVRVLREVDHIEEGDPWFNLTEGQAARVVEAAFSAWRMETLR